MKVASFLPALAGLLFSAFVLSGAEKTGTVKDLRVNVRGNATLASEVVTQLKKGEEITILDEIDAKDPKPGDPVKWYKIAMPANTPLWVFADFVDSTNNVVKSRKLNVRSGPGENFSVVGVLQKDQAVKPIRTVSDWIEIETPPGAFGFVAAELITSGGQMEIAKASPDSRTQKDKQPALQEPQSKRTETVEKKAEAKPEQKEQVTREEFPGRRNEPAEIKVQTKPEEVIVSTSDPVVVKPATETAPPVVETKETVPPPVTPSQPVAIETKPSETVAKESTPAADLPKRIVTREGFVRRALSIQSPSYFVLENAENGQTINYLHSNNPDLKLKMYLGFKIVVTGEELVDRRWPSVPVIEVDKIEVP